MSAAPHSNDVHTVRRQIAEIGAGLFGPDVSAAANVQEAATRAISLFATLDDLDSTYKELGSRCDDKTIRSWETVFPEVEKFAEATRRSGNGNRNTSYGKTENKSSIAWLKVQIIEQVLQSHAIALRVRYIGLCLELF